MNKKVTFILGGLSKGGAERVVCNLSNYLVEKKFKVDIIVMLTNKIEYELSPKVNIIDFSISQRNDKKMLIKWIKQLHYYMKKNPERTIVSFFVKINLVVLIASFRCKNRLIVSERSDPFLDGRSRLIKILTKIMYRKSNYIVFQTNELAKKFNNFGKRIRVIPNPIIHNQEYANIYPKDNLIVSVGRLDKAKNQKMLIEAVNMIRKELLNYKIIFYGEGPERLSLECLIEKYDLKNIVYLAGNTDNVLHDISKSKIFIMTSNYEGMSNALQEAMSLGLCCITTNCLGAEELIDNKSSGLIINKEDTKKLAFYIKELIENEKICYSYGRKAYEKSLDYSINHVADKWMEII